MTTKTVGLFLVGEDGTHYTVAAAPRKPHRGWAIGARRSGRKGQTARLDSVQRTFLDFCSAPDEAGARRLVTDLRDEVQPLVGEGSGLADEVFVARCLVGLLAEGHVGCLTVGPLVAELGSRFGANLLAVGVRALSDPQLLLLPLEESVDAVLALLEALGPLQHPSVWVQGSPGEPRLLRWRSQVPSPEAPGLARRVLAGERSASSGAWTAVRIRSFERPRAALVFSADAGRREQAEGLAMSLERLLGRMFERSSLRTTNADQSAALVRSSERRLTRVGFDLHDGPLQDVALMSGELAAIRASVAGLVNGDARLTNVLDRVDDLAALVSCTDNNLREVANSLDAIGELRRPFRETLGALLRTFSVRTGIEPEVELTGDIDGLSDSQRITLLRVVQESLTNVRDHSQAEHVRIVVTAGATRVDAVVRDDGKGFDVEPALRDAARRGRMGLLGIIERVRLLGGFCDIVSRPGGGTCVSLTVARWTPEMAALATKGAEASAR